MASANIVNESKTAENTSPAKDGSQKQPVVCVFCGASPGNSPAHLSAARSLAQVFHANGIKLVYGGGTVGVMGEVARNLVSLSGPDSVHGIIPKALLRYERKYIEINGDGNGQQPEPDARDLIDEAQFGRTTVVADMHTRKQMMAREVIEGGPGSGFVALSGGYGTLEELMEVVTWNQLGIHARPVIVFNVEGYWDGLLKWVQGAVDAGFIAKGNSGIMVEGRTSEEVVERLRDYTAAEARFKLHWGEK